MPPTSKPLLNYMIKRGLSAATIIEDGAILNPSAFPVAAVETSGAILFADLPGYSKLAKSLSPAELACFVSLFFAWIDGEARRRNGGIVDKFIGDEIMVVFLASECTEDPLKAAMKMAKAMRDNDPYAFEPKFGSLPANSRLR